MPSNDEVSCVKKPVEKKKVYSVSEHFKRVDKASTFDSESKTHILEEGKKD
jgi:hypothetical protein